MMVCVQVGKAVVGSGGEVVVAVCLGIEAPRMKWKWTASLPNGVNCLRSCSLAAVTSGDAAPLVCQY